MSSLQDQYDEAMFDFSMGDYATCIAKLETVLAEDAGYFDARLALGMAWCRQGDLDRAIAEGHKAEQLQPRDQLVHTNLSLFYVKAGNQEAAEHHALQSRVASWKKDLNPPAVATAPTGSGTGPETPLPMAETPKPETVRITGGKPARPTPRSDPADPA